MTPSHRPPSEQARAPLSGQSNSDGNSDSNSKKTPEMTATSSTDSTGLADAAWVEVVTRMDEVYADLVHSQVALEQKHADLEQARDFIDGVLKAMSDVLIVVDQNGRIQQVNRAMEELVGRSMDELLGNDMSDLFSPAAGQRFEQLIVDWGNDAVTDYEVEVIDSTGQASPMAINCSPRFDAPKRLWGYVITGRPLGELRRAYAALNSAHENLKKTQNQLIQSEKLASLGLLIAGVAHELNNPISFVFGNMHALKRYGDRFASYLQAIHTGATDQQRQALREELRIDHSLRDIGPLIDGTLEGAERVTEIVQNLSRFANPQDNSVQSFDLVRLTRTSLRWVVKNGVVKNNKIDRDDAKSRDGAPSVEVQAPEQLIISGKEGQVHQILINLIQNAFDALEGNGADASLNTGTDVAESQAASADGNPRISLHLSETPQHAIVEVCDRGTGITDTDMLRIFDPFFTRKPVGKGTGLGLYISYGLATEQCGGELTIENRRDGGVRATLRLPKVLPT